ncbi:MAG: phosphate acyltransferase PlsX [Rickettsiales bacterium]|jgi:glycerol-3-phosphate acyltransferase PlsX|nr:phosphate acyltransferase PlsX [Rickettsiales bacterium]
MVEKICTIAIDAMGGDSAPAMVIAGLDSVYDFLCDSGVSLLLFGQRDKLEPLMARHPRLASIAEVVDAPDVVSGDDKPSRVIRSGRSTSMWMAIESVKSGRADAVVSAGNTGCLMGISKLLISMISGIKRPAISTLLPTVKGNQMVMLDLGANSECDETNIFQFAIMGSAYAQAVGIKRPKVAVLNIGSEAGKGFPYLNAADEMIRGVAGKLSFEYAGFAEGDDIFHDKVDVIATDGFSGNIALKTLEGTVKFVASGVKDLIRSSWLAKIGALFMLGGLKRFKNRYDPRKYNGAVLLGLDGIVVKSHGGTDAYGFSRAVCYAVDLVVGNFVTRVKDEIARLEE